MWIDWCHWIDVTGEHLEESIVCTTNVCPMYPQILGYLFGSFTVKHGSFPDLPQIHPSWIQAESGAVRGALWSRRDSIAVRDGSFVTYEIPIWLEEEGHPASSSYFRLGYQGFDSWLNLNHILFGVIKMDASAAIPITQAMRWPMIVGNGSMGIVD